MKKHLIIMYLFLSLASSVNASTFTQPSSITGSYHCKGYDPFAKVAYEGKMQIKKTGDTYSLSSDYGKDATYTGTGMYDASLHLMVGAFTNPTLPEESGLGMLYVQKDGSLLAKWTYLNKTTIASDLCTKL